MSEYTAEMAHAAAARGAAWLDEKCPGWERRIDTEELAMREADLCILGQTADCILGPAPEGDENYAGFYRVLDSEAWTTTGTAAEFGFDLPPYMLHATIAEWEMLTIAWREIIRERLAVTA